MTEQEWLDIFSDNLQDLLRSRGCNQAELADELGVSQAAISRYINKRQMPTIRVVVNMAHILRCNVSDLIDFGDSIEC